MVVAVREVMFLGVVQSRVGYHAFLPRPSWTHNNIRLRPALFRYFAFDFEPHQHGLRRHGYVDPDTQSECGSCSREL